jgi:hypothetical protein
MITISTLGRHFSTIIGYKVIEKVALDSALKTIKHLFRLDMFWQEHENSGNKIKRIQNAEEGLKKYSIFGLILR